LLIASLQPICAVLYQLYNGFKQKRLMMNKNLTMGDNGGGLLNRQGTMNDDA
jgi:hypothetical protein